MSDGTQDAVLAPTLFIQGRDLAVEMISVGAALAELPDGACEAWRKFRVGNVPQNRFAAIQLRQLIDHPGLLDGFAAVLSARLGVGMPDLPANLQQASEAEFSVGLPGADGTDAGTSEPAAAEASVLGDNPFAQAVARASQLISNAIELVDQALDMGETGDYGYRCMRMGVDVASDCVTDLQEAATHDQLTEALDRLHDARSLFKGGASLHWRDARGIVLCAADDFLAAAALELDVPPPTTGSATPQHAQIAPREPRGQQELAPDRAAAH